jgi:cytoskeletal protein CcmA (bactofilin family)
MIWFVLNSKRIAGISIDGLFAGEIKSTRELLAYENGVAVDEIKVEVEQ